MLDFLGLLVEYWVLKGHLMLCQLFIYELVYDAKHIRLRPEHMHLVHLQLRPQLLINTIPLPQFILHFTLVVPQLLLCLFDDPVHLHYCILILQFLELTLLQLVLQLFGFLFVLVRECRFCCLV